MDEPPTDIYLSHGRILRITDVRRAADGAMEVGGWELIPPPAGTVAAEHLRLDAAIKAMKADLLQSVAGVLLLERLIRRVFHE